jgi:hypothetical protein
MNEATVADFFKTIRVATAKQKSYSHQLTKAIFAKIVRDAIRKRTLKQSGHTSTNSLPGGTYAKDSNRNN